MKTYFVLYLGHEPGKPFVARNLSWDRLEAGSDAEAHRLMSDLVANHAGPLAAVSLVAGGRETMFEVGSGFKLAGYGDGQVTDNTSDTGRQTISRWHPAADDPPPVGQEVAICWRGREDFVVGHLAADGRWMRGGTPLWGAADWWAPLPAHPEAKKA